MEGGGTLIGKLVDRERDRGRVGSEEGERNHRMLRERQMKRLEVRG